MDIKDIAAIVGVTLDANGTPEATRENAANALRANARLMRTGDRGTAISANKNAVLIAGAALQKGWLNRERVLASLMDAGSNTQRAHSEAGVTEEYARHIERVADMIEQATDDQGVQAAAYHVFAGPQPHRFAKEVM